MNESIKRLAAIAENIAQEDGVSETSVPYLSIFSYTDSHIPLPEGDEPFFYMVLRGKFRLFNTSGISEYTAGQFFISPLDVPGAGHADPTSPAEPFLSLAVRFSLADIIGVILDTEGEINAGDASSSLTEDSVRIVSVVERMLSLCVNPASAGFMANHLRRELMFNILIGRFGQPLLKGVMNIQNAGDIYQINSWIKKNFRDVFSVQELADKSHMSVSRFHQKFKNAVGMGPLQCQKQLRLSEARKLMLVQELSVTEAGMEVGYESLSQFIRDYRKHFGMTPLKDIQQLRSALKKQPD